jgi:hypothetical protein
VAIIGGDRIVLRTETMQNKEFSASKVHFFLSVMTPLYLLIIVFSTFDPLTETGMALYLKISQNVKIYLD